MTTPRVYAFSGLGADKRTFARMDFSGMDVTHVEWIQPRRAESLSSYVFRLAQHYAIPKQGAYAIGLSFGGICLAELATAYNFEKLVLLSSAKTKNELPKSIGFSKLLSVHKLLPNGMLTKPNVFVNWLFGVSSAEDKRTLAEILHDSDPEFLKWAVNEMLHWDNVVIPKHCLHIHGDKDRIIPIKNVDYSIKIAGGGHFMTLNKAEEIEYHIRNYLL